MASSEASSRRNKGGSNVIPRENPQTPPLAWPQLFDERGSPIPMPAPYSEARAAALGLREPKTPLSRSQPATVPRRVTDATPARERRALEELKRHMTFENMPAPDTATSAHPTRERELVQLIEDVHRQRSSYDELLHRLQRLEDKEEALSGALSHHKESKSHSDAGQHDGSTTVQSVSAYDKGVGTSPARHRQPSAVEDKSDEEQIQALLQQRNLLKDMVAQQKKLKLLQEKYADLMAMREDMSKQLSSLQDQESSLVAALPSISMQGRSPSSAHAQPTGFTSVAALPTNADVSSQTSSLPDMDMSTALAGRREDLLSQLEALEKQKIKIARLLDVMKAQQNSLDDGSDGGLSFMAEERGVGSRGLLTDAAGSRHPELKGGKSSAVAALQAVRDEKTRAEQERSKLQKLKSVQQYLKQWESMLDSDQGAQPRASSAPSVSLSAPSSAQLPLHRPSTSGGALTARSAAMLQYLREKAGNDPQLQAEVDDLERRRRYIAQLEKALAQQAEFDEVEPDRSDTNRLVSHTYDSGSDEGEDDDADDEIGDDDGEEGDHETLAATSSSAPQAEYEALVAAQESRIEQLRTYMEQLDAQLYANLDTLARVRSSEKSRAAGSQSSPYLTRLEEMRHQLDVLKSQSPRALKHGVRAGIPEDYLNGGGAEGDEVSDTGTYTVEPAMHVAHPRHQGRPADVQWKGQIRQRPQRRGFVVDSDDELEEAEALGKKPRLHKPSSVPADSSEPVQLSFPSRTPFSLGGSPGFSAVWPSVICPAREEVEEQTGAAAASAPVDSAHSGAGTETYVQRVHRQLVASTQLCNKLLQEQISMAQVLSSVAGSEQQAAAAQMPPPGPVSTTPGRYFMDWMPPWGYPYWYPPPPWMPTPPVYPAMPTPSFTTSPPTAKEGSAHSAMPTAAFDHVMSNPTSATQPASTSTSNCFQKGVMYPFVASSAPPAFTGIKRSTASSQAASLVSKSNAIGETSSLADISHRATVGSDLAEEHAQILEQTAGVGDTGLTATLGEKDISDDESELSLFGALRDAIYSEVATLISMNEDSPSWLVDIFRELQLLTEDSLRQQALTAVQNIISDFWTQNAARLQTEDKRAALPEAWALNGEQTPSESMQSTDDDEARTKVSGRQVAHDRYDYMESVESASTQSTPTNASSSDVPFARDSLGATAISLDKEVERLSAVRLSPSPSPSGVQKRGTKVGTDVLDQQVRVMMMKVMPILKQSMESAVNEELVTRLMNAVMEETQNQSEILPLEEGWEKLEESVRKAMNGFIGKKLKDCGEDLLVKTSEALFNELAYVALRQHFRPTEKPLVSHSEDQPHSPEVKITRMTVDSAKTEADVAVQAMAAATASEHEDLGKDRDDELAQSVNGQEALSNVSAENTTAQASSEVEKPSEKSSETALADGESRPASNESGPGSLWVMVPTPSEETNEDSSGSKKESTSAAASSQHVSTGEEGDLTLEDLPSKLDKIAVPLDSQGDQSSVTLIANSIAPADLAGEPDAIQEPGKPSDTASDQDAETSSV